MGLSSSNVRYTRAIKSKKNGWATGFWRRFPTLVVLSLLIALASVFGIVGVLIASDGVPIARFVNVRWQGTSLAVQPQVILSILSTIVNIALAFALSKAAVVAWWLRALRGTTTEELHVLWGCSKFFLPKYQNFTTRTWLGLAALLCGIVAIDGPLLQRSSTVVIDTITETKNASLPLSPDPFVAGGTGYDSAHSWRSTMYTSAFTSVLQAYTNRTPIVIPNSGCTGDCWLMVEAAGFDNSCEETDVPTNLPPEADLKESSQYNITTFNVSFSDNTYDENGLDNHFYRLYVNTIFKSRPEFPEPYRQHSCILTENVGTYYISMANDTVTNIEPLSPLKNLTKMLIPANWTYPIMFSVRTNTIGGFTRAMNEKYGASGSFNMNGPFFQVLPFCSSAFAADCPMSIVGPGLSYVNSSDYDSGHGNMTWADPMPDILNTIRELSFRFVLECTARNFTPPIEMTLNTRRGAGFCDPYRDAPVNQTVACPIENFSQPVHLSQSQNLPVYRTNWSWAAGAISLMLVSILSIFPVLFGFWRLGREFSDSPIEIAKAFGAPLLDAGNSNGDLVSTLSDVGVKRVRYGVVQSASPQSGILHEDIPLGEFPSAQLHSMLQSKSYAVIIDEEEQSETRSIDAGLKSSRVQHLSFAKYKQVRPPLDGERFQ